MPSPDEWISRIEPLAALIAGRRMRRLFQKLVSEILLLGDAIGIEIGPFEARLGNPNGFFVSISPYRDIFLVRIGETSPHEIRVTALEGYFTALDLALHHYLVVQSEAVAGPAP